MCNVGLMTSTLSPDPDAQGLKVVDVNQRLKQYQKALQFYCQRVKDGTFDSLVYVDNSGASLDALKKITREEGVADRVDFISYKSTLSAKNHSRFYLEINLIDYFIKHCRFNDDTVFWKLTGRYTIRNITAIVASKEPGCDLYVNCRNHPSPWADFYVVGFTRKAYETLFSDLGIYKLVRNGEQLLRQQIESDKASDLKICKRFAIVPRVEGTRGYDGGNYSSPKDVAKYYLRRFLNIVAPRIWV